MCKIFAMTDMTNVPLTHEFVDAVNRAVTGSGDRDGFGYAVVTDTNNIYGEKTLNPNTFVMGIGDTSQTSGLSIVDNSSVSFGVMEGQPKSFIGHGRLSTNQVNLPNTHPFYNGEVALIHNGVVSDPNRAVAGQLETTCDTEILLRLWEAGGVNAIQDNAGGYYAIAAVTSDGMLHIIRDSMARLFVAWSDTVQSYIIATTPDIIEDVAAEMNWEVETPMSVRENTHAIFDGNVIVEDNPISPMGYTSSISAASVSKSLGNVKYYTDEEIYGEDAPAYRKYGS